MPNDLQEAFQPSLWQSAQPQAKPARASKPPAEKPHYIGHRDRLRDRAALSLPALPDYELLELQLFRSIPRGDVKPLAKALIARFGSLPAVLAASTADLKTVPGVGEAVALDLKLLHETALRLSQANVTRRPVITSWTQLLDYVRLAMAHEPREQFRVLFLDTKNQLIADEVICGFARTGEMWGSDTYDLAPDMMTCAKALSASYIPIAALMISERVFEAMTLQSRKISLFGHGFTYSGHPVAAAVAVETLKIYEERDVVAMSKAASPALQRGLRAYADHPIVGEVRGVGMIAGVELSADRAARKPFDPTNGAGAIVQEEMKARGVLVRALGDVVAFCPPLIISDEEIKAVTARFGEALDAAAAKLI